MKAMKRVLAVMLAAFIVAGVFMPAPAQAATKISGGVTFGGWVSSDMTACAVGVKSQGVQSFEYRVYYNSGKFKKKGTSGVYVKSGKQYAKVYGLPKRSCSYISIRLKKNGAWTKWSSKYLIVPAVLSSDVSGSTNKYKQTTKLSWKKTTGASRYDIFLSTKSTGGWKKVASTTKRTVTLSKFNGKKFKSGQTYYFRIVAKKKKNGKWVASRGITQKFYNGSFWFIY